MAGDPAEATIEYRDVEIVGVFVAIEVCIAGVADTIAIDIYLLWVGVEGAVVSVTADSVTVRVIERIEST